MKTAISLTIITKIARVQGFRNETKNGTLKRKINFKVFHIDFYFILDLFKRSGRKIIENNFYLSKKLN